MTRLRPPAVADYFYPADAQVLREAVESYLRIASSSGPIPKAIVAPHAGYVYSGPVAASAYRLLQGARARFTRVALLGPAHRVYLRGIGLSSAAGFSTPMGDVEIDRETCIALSDLPDVGVADAAHAPEHSLEVHLPFLQAVLGEFTLVPLVVGMVTPARVAAVLEHLSADAETLIVVSSDLSHYHDYDTAKGIDAQTTEAIETLDWARIGPEQACGCNPLNGLLHFARGHGLRAQTLDVRSSGDTAGPRDRVVGYGAWAFYPERADAD